MRKSHSRTPFKFSIPLDECNRFWTFLKQSANTNVSRIYMKRIKLIITCHKYTLKLYQRFPNTRIQNRISYQRWKPRSLRAFRGNSPSSGISVFTFVNYTSCIVSLGGKRSWTFPRSIYNRLDLRREQGPRAEKRIASHRIATPVNTDPRRLSRPSNGRRMRWRAPRCIHVASTLIAFPFRDTRVSV